MSEMPAFPPPIPAPPSLPKTSGAASLLWKSAIAIIALNAIEIIAHVYRYQMVDGIFNRNNIVDMGALEGADNFVGLAVVGGLVATLTFIVCLLVWINQTTKKLRQLGYVTEKGSAWAVWSFFIPIANLFLVYGTLNDLVTGIRKTSPQNAGITFSGLQKFWWFLIGSTFLSRAADSVTGTNEDFDFSSFQTETIMAVIACGLTITSLYFAFKFFKENLKP